MSARTKQLFIFAILAVFVVGIIIVVRRNKGAAGDAMSEQIFAMDTVMNLTVYKTEGMVGELEDVLGEMRECVYRLENELSVTKDDSEIAKLNAASGVAVQVSDETYELLNKTIEVAKDTDGSFDPTIYPIVKLWGFTTGEYRVPSEDERKNTLKIVDYKKVEFPSDKELIADKAIHEKGLTSHIEAPRYPKVIVDGAKYTRLPEKMQIDLGACAKGYLSDKLCDILREHKTSGIVSLGGNVQSVGTKPDGTEFTVGIVDPKDTSKIFEKITSKNEAVVTSGNYERFFEKDGKRYHHIMDSRTGAPADNGLASVTVIGPSGFCCDAYATAFFIMGEDKTNEFLKNHSDYKAAFIYEDGSSSGF